LRTTALKHEYRFKYCFYCFSQYDNSKPNEPEDTFYGNYFLSITGQSFKSIDVIFKQLSNPFEHIDLYTINKL